MRAAPSFLLLGPVEVRNGDQPVPLGRRQERLLLAVLLLDVNRPIATTRLIELVWPGKVPEQPVRTLQVYASRLRKALADGLDTPPEIVGEHDHFAIYADPEHCDVHRFHALLRAARKVADPSQRAAALRTALGLWRGPALADAAPEELRDTLCRGLRESQDTALELRVEADLAAGRHAELLPELSELTARNPTRERIAAARMLALYRSGRRADALDAYRILAARLADDLGVDPSPLIQDQYVAMLRSDPALDLVPAPAEHAVGIPAQLPTDVVGFVGRTEVLARLDKLRTSTAAVDVGVVAGPAGVGKTSLAVHWAHQVADRFPDGQLYVNLRGFDPSGLAKTPAEALRGFLNALGVPSAEIPDDPDVQVGKYRTLLAKKRVLILLDNARDSSQVRPLVPGASGCLVLVTSRQQLTALAATDGARLISLELLSRDEAHELLAARLGMERVLAEPEAVEQIVTRCARLPLALAVVAARAAGQPTFALAELALQLGSLNALQGGDSATDVRAVFSWSYRQLTPPAARLFRLLGLHPGPDTSVNAAASLAAVPPEEVRAMLTELTSNHLLTEHTPGRYTSHDLLRAYAADLVQTVESEQERHEAMRRLLDYFLQTAYTASVAIGENRDPITAESPLPEVTTDQLTTDGEATIWFRAEHQSLIAVIHHARSRWPTHAWQLAWAVTPYLDRQGHWHDWATVQADAVIATASAGDPIGQSWAHRNLARACVRLRRLADAGTHARRGLELAVDAGNGPEQAHTLVTLAILSDLEGSPAEALRHVQRALALYQAAGDDHLGDQADALSMVGWYQIALGEHHKALVNCEKALALQRKLEDVTGQGATLDSLGYAHHHLGQHAEAIACFERALGLIREHGHQHHVATILDHLGDTHKATGSIAKADDAWQQALTILDELGHPDADAVRLKLERQAAEDGLG